MLGINGAEFLVLLLVALLVVGPERLPGYTEQLASWVRTLRRFVTTARERVADELGEEVGDVDWASLDPRRYDPRRIVRDALLEDVLPAPTEGRRYTSGKRAARTSAAGAAGGGGAARARATSLEPGTPAPFDDEAT